jgi:hypothetical protein
MSTLKKTEQRAAHATIQATRRELAREHHAMHEALLGIGRWTSGNSYIQMEIATALMPTSQVKWHEKAQQDFQAWLAQGGFAGLALPSPARPGKHIPATQQCDPVQHVLAE